MANTSFTIHALAEELKAGRLTSVQLCQRCLDAVAAKDGEIGTFIKYDAEKILRLAAESDARRKEGKALSDWDGI
ncbi:MAG: Asp-tRNA(Asn)/Glu-tRNA(Gln) amidotransferase GatCAB subunit A, partial [Lentisphaeria bacterium]|nr:Asp-tRNA(Asn)/Glu-tRNA(Gln) amidotransferase GatCAB subunit A [Lentisphaeria bacterium]